MSTQTYSRRSVLRAGAGAAIGGVALANARPARAQTTFDGYLDGVGNYDGVVDRTGNGEVSIEVGTEANGGNFGFGPAAVQVDPGTTVTWEWVNGSHNVEAEDGSFESELTSEQGFTFEQTFDSEGVVKYFCMPHKAMGMKGVVVVGGLPGGSSGGSGGSSGGAADSGSTPGFDGYLDNADNYDGLVDETGSSDVTVEVGSQANGGNFGFGPAAVRVDPGTTVTWEWVAGSHNVQAEDGSFESELTNEQGFTFEQTFDEEGVVKYFCMPHKSMGMKGVVVVGDPDLGAGGSGGESGGSDAGGAGGGNGELTGADWGAIAFGASLVAGLLSPLAFAAFLDRDDEPRPGERVRQH